MPVAALVMPGASGIARSELVCLKPSNGLLALEQNVVPIVHVSAQYGSRYVH